VNTVAVFQRRVLCNIGGRQSGVPVVRMNHLRLPGFVELAGSQMRCNPAEEGIAPMIVIPVATVWPKIRIAVTPV